MDTDKRYQLFFTSPEGTTYEYTHNPALSRAESLSCGDALVSLRYFSTTHPTHRWSLRELGKDEELPFPWKLREELRFVKGEYAEVPWHNEPWYQAKHEEHFCHISTEQGCKVAFTENEDKGKRDIQQRMKPGRYLNRYFSEHLTNEQIEQWVAKLSVAVEDLGLKITQDADEIEQVYVGGPRSCMSHSAGHFEGHCHPCRVYAGPDLALAYLGSADAATARCIVWPEKKKYGRVYGDVSRMTLVLQQAGYTADSGDLTGARLQLIEDDNGDGIIVPYVDGYSYGRVADGFLVIGSGDVDLQCTEGASAAGRPSCDRCGARVEEDELTFVEGRWENQSWCDECLSYATVCDHVGHHMADRDYSFTEVNTPYGTVTVADCHLAPFGAHEVDGEWYTEAMLEVCPETGDWFLPEQGYDWGGELLSLEGAEQRMSDAEPDEAYDSHVRLQNQRTTLTIAKLEQVISTLSRDQLGLHHPPASRNFRFVIYDDPLAQLAS